MTADVAQTVSAETRRAIEARRSPASMTAREGREWVREFVVAAARVSRLPEVAEDLNETMRRLAAAGPEIIRHTHDPALRAAAREAVASADIPGGRPGSATDRDHAKWWGLDVDRAPTRTPGEIAARSAQDTQGTTIAADAAKNRGIGRDR